MDFTTCPECGSVAQVLERFVLESTHGPVEHARTRCVHRHWFVLPVASLARRVRAGPVPSEPLPVRGTGRGAAGCG